MLKLPFSKSAAPLTAVIDIATSKASVLALDVSTPAPRIAGYGEAAMAGMKGGIVVDPGLATEHLLRAVRAAEQMAGGRIGPVHVVSHGGPIDAAIVSAAVTLDPPVVQRGDVARVLAGATAYAERNSAILMHQGPIGYRLDGRAVAGDPADRFGRQLAADVCLVTTDGAGMAALVDVAARAGLDVVAIPFAPEAGASAVTTADERRDGVVVADMGAGTTTLAMFQGGCLLGATTIASGGYHLSVDVATALQIPLTQAERIKCLYASVVSAHAGDHDTVTYRIGSNHEIDTRPAAHLVAAAVETTTRADLRNIVTPRVTALLRLVAERISATPFGDPERVRLVLTGGASQLPGLAAHAAHQLGRPVRTGRPREASGLPGDLRVPALAALGGGLQAMRAGDNVTARTAARRLAPAQARSLRVAV